MPLSGSLEPADGSFHFCGSYEEVVIDISKLFFSKTDFAAFGKGLQLLASGFNLRVSQPTFG